MGVRRAEKSLRHAEMIDFFLIKSPALWLLPLLINYTYVLFTSLIFSLVIIEIIKERQSVLVFSEPSREVDMTETFQGGYILGSKGQRVLLDRCMSMGGDLVHAVMPFSQLSHWTVVFTVTLLES